MSDFNYSQSVWLVHTIFFFFFSGVIKRADELVTTVQKCKRYYNPFLHISEVVHLPISFNTFSNTENPKC